MEDENGNAFAEDMLKVAEKYDIQVNKLLVFVYCMYVLGLGN